MNRSQKLAIAHELAHYGELLVFTAERNPEQRLNSDPNKLVVSRLLEEMAERYKLVLDLGGGSTEFTDPLWRLQVCKAKLQQIEASLTSAEVG